MFMDGQNIRKKLNKRKVPVKCQVNSVGLKELLLYLVKYILCPLEGRAEWLPDLSPHLIFLSFCTYDFA